MGAFSFLFGSDDSVSNSKPSVNVDGSPMCGSVDINGNPYGVTDTTNDFTCSMEDSFDSFSNSFTGFDDL